jgi:hypothetical protein
LTRRRRVTQKQACDTLASRESHIAKDRLAGVVAKAQIREMRGGLLAFAAAQNDWAAFKAVTGVPEPTSLSIVVAGATLTLRRRHYHLGTTSC